MQVSKTKCLMLYTMLPSLVYYINYICKIFSINGWASVVYYPFITVFSVFLFFLSFSQNVIKTSFCCIVVWVSLIFSSLLGNYNAIFGRINSGYSFVLSDLNLLLSMALPVIYLYYLGVEYDEFLDEIAKPSIIVVSLQCIILLLTLRTGKYSISNDYMSFAYLGILSFVGCVHNWKKSILYKFFSCVSFFIISISGCRGALLSALIFVAVLWFFRMSLRDVNQIVKFILGIVICFIIFLKFNDILQFLSEKLSTIGFNSRSISK